MGNDGKRDALGITCVLTGAGGLFLGANSYAHGAHGWGSAGIAIGVVGIVLGYRFLKSKTKTEHDYDTTT